MNCQSGAACCFARALFMHGKDIFFSFRTNMMILGWKHPYPRLHKLTAERKEVFGHHSLLRAVRSYSGRI